jgi:hypothetical protein
LLATNPEVDESIRPMLKLTRESIERLQKTDYALVSSLERDPLLRQRLENLRTVPGVGPITALAWALEIGDVSRFHSVKQAISYCGLCGDEKSSAEKVLRTLLSKQRNKHVQHVLMEAAKLAPKQSHELALVYERAKEKGNVNRATIAVARKMVTNLLAVDRANRPFVPAETRSTAAAWRTQKKERDHAARRLPGPADGRLSDGLSALRLPPNCFGTGSEHKLNHLQRSMRLEAANGCPVLRETGTTAVSTQASCESGV